MRKLKLDPEDLRVETFAAGGRAARIGTVRGNMPVEYPVDDDSVGEGGCGGTMADPSGRYTCDCPTYRKTCAMTCGIDYCTAYTCLTHAPCCP